MPTTKSSVVLVVVCMYVRHSLLFFEVKELKDFPQASGFLDIQEIFVVTKNTDRETSVAQVR